MRRPPSLADWLLGRRLHPDERDEIVGDLHEQFRRRVDTDGARAASRWYWREALALVWRFDAARRDVISRTHDRRRGAWAAANLRLDARYAWRSLRSSRAFATVALLTLTLGIGLATAVFSLVHDILLRPLPYPHADRLVRLSESAPASSALSRLAGTDESRKHGISDMAIGVWIRSTSALDLVTPMSDDDTTVVTATASEHVPGAEVGGALFDLLGVQPVAGRLLTPADNAADAPPVAVISERLWRQGFDARPDLVGKTLVIDGEARTLVGIAPAAADLPTPGTDVWTPGHWQWPSPSARRMFSMSIDVVARLKPDATIEQAQAEGRAVALRIAESQAAAAPPAAAGGPQALPEAPAITARRLLDDIVAPVHAALVTLLAGMTLVLAAGSVNLANLLLARGTARGRDIAVRLALGATRWRILRPLLFEQLLLAAAGGAGGAALGWWLLRALPWIAPADLPRLAAVHFDAWSLLFAVAGAMAVALAVGLLPAFHAPDGLAALGTGTRRTDGRDTGRLRRGLVVVQMALAAVLLVGAALVGRTLVALLRVNPGYQPRGVLTAQIALPDGSWRSGREGRFFADLVDRLRQREDVTAAGVASTLPLERIGSAGSFGIVGRPKPVPPEPWPMAVHLGVTADYMKAVGTRIIRGRGFTAQDTADAEKVAVIDETLARQYFPGEDPIGQSVTYPANTARRIVGIAESIHQGRLSAEPKPVLYLAAPQLPDILAYNALTGGVAIRTTRDPLSLIPFVRTSVRELDPASPVYNEMRLDDRLAQTIAEPRFYALALGLFALLALSTAVLGVYGVLAYAVERRRVEFGVRRALGAREEQIRALVIGQGLRLSVIGLGIGLGVAAAGVRLLRSLLFGVTPFDPVSFAAVAGLIVGVAVLAAWHPARRALRIDPAAALRTE